ncbi:hypothetical protein TNCV_4358771 [Trichonephila clavipes]|nr:hypothetical protein TNCV_4358771 [Trichonephila clavipes]
MKAEMDLELQKLKLQLEAQKKWSSHGNDTDISEQWKLEFKKLIPRFNSHFTINHDVNRHPLSTSAQQQTSMFIPRTDGPCVILSQQSPTTFKVANLEDPDGPNGVYHTSALRPHQYPSS